MTSEQKQDSYLVGHVLLLQDCTYRLTKLLGGGLTSRVYLAERKESAKSNADYPKQVAAKIARLGQYATLTEHFESEYETLKKLNKVEARCAESHQRSHHFFPLVYHFEKRYITPSGDWQVLLLEFVDMPQLSTIAAQSPDRRLDEPVALDVAAQYAHMLELLHSTGLTCTDRKLDDWYWDQARLMVLDWNVVSEGDPAGDLFRFGLLWHELLLGIKPQFSYEQKQLTTRLSQQPGWDKLSYGTQQILAKALHSNPQQRYRVASELGQDIEVHLSHWQQSAESLSRKAQRLETSDPQTAFAAIDLARMFARRGKSSLLGVDKLYGQLRGKVIDQGIKLLNQAREYIRGRRYSAAQKSLSQAADVATDNPELAIKVARLKVLVRGYVEIPDLEQNLEDWLKLMDVVEKLDDKNQLEQNRQVFDDLQLNPELTLLKCEFDLHQDLWQAKKYSNMGKHKKAAERFEEAGDKWRRLEYRDILSLLIENPYLAFSKSRKLYRVDELPRSTLQAGLEKLLDNQFDAAAKAFAEGLAASPEQELADSLNDAQTITRLCHHFDQAYQQEYLDLSIFWLEKLVKFPADGLRRSRQKVEQRLEQSGKQQETVEFKSVPDAALTCGRQRQKKLVHNLFEEAKKHYLTDILSTDFDDYTAVGYIRSVLNYYHKTFQDDDFFNQQWRALIDECRTALNFRTQQVKKIQRYPNDIRDAKAALTLIDAQEKYTSRLAELDADFTWPSTKICDDLEQVNQRSDIQNKIKYLIEALGCISIKSL